MQYIHGGDVYRNVVKYDFSINTNPLGMPSECIRQAKEGVELSAYQYPDVRGQALRGAIAAKKHIKEEYVILGNGAAELLYALCQFLRPRRGKAVAPSFQEYERALDSVDAEFAVWGLKEQEAFAVSEAFADSIGGEEDIVFLCNPNNPTGGIVESSLLQRIIAKCEDMGTYLCLDECFLPFLKPERENELSMLRCLEEYPHLIVLRAFTKIYGMSGLRLGYACTSNIQLLEGIRNVLQPWNTSVPAQMAGIAAMQCEEYLAETRRLITEERQYLCQKMKMYGLVEKIYPSEGNYLFFKSRLDLKERLLKKKILIRSCGDFRNLTEGYFRIAVRTHEENEALICAWESLKDED